MGIITLGKIILAGAVIGLVVYNIIEIVKASARISTLESGYGVDEAAAKTEIANLKKGQKRCCWKIALGIIIGGIGLVVLGSTVIIKTNRTGVVYRMGQIQDTALSAGFHVITPVIDSVTVVDNRQQEYTFEGQIWGESKEKTPVYGAGITVTASIRPEASVWMVRNVAGGADNVVTPDIVGTALKDAMTELEAENVTVRSYIEPLAVQKLQAKLDEKYDTQVVVVKSIVIAQMDFDEKYNQAIQERSNARINKDTADTNNQTMLQNAEAQKKKDIIEAQAAAEIKKIEAETEAERVKKLAEAEAQATLRKAEAQAEANQKLAASLTDGVLQSQYYEAWNGELPKVVGDSTSILDMGQIMK